MTAKKKKKQEELLEIWTNLKPKLLTTITELKDIKEHGLQEVQYSAYQNYLETKLERVRNLIADNELEKLKSLARQGQI